MLYGANIGLNHATPLPKETITMRFNRTTAKYFLETYRSGFQVAQLPIENTSSQKRVELDGQIEGVMSPHNWMEMEPGVVPGTV